MSESLDELVASLNAQCDVAANPFDTNRPHPRFSEYARLREPSSLMGDQNKRRTQFLERQKSKRDKFINLQRRLVENPALEADDIDLEDDSQIDETSLEKKSDHPCTSVYKRPNYTNQLMLSEWLVDVPTDLEDNWLVKPCPKGQRMLVIAHQGSTKAYSKAGHLVASFGSVLPGGNRSSKGGRSILDCIYNWENRTYYILDVMAWSNIVLRNCETEFRFYWLKSKFDELPEISLQTDKYRNAFAALPSVECREDSLTELMSHIPMFLEEKDPGLDGLLFYHKHCLYESGSTPLVTWIKPFMLEDVLGVKVNEKYLDERPPGYCDQAGYIKEFEEARVQKAAAKKERFRHRGKHNKLSKNKMDCENDPKSEVGSEEKME